jgi:hypothetical protein
MTVAQMNVMIVLRTLVLKIMVMELKGAMMMSL